MCTETNFPSAGSGSVSGTARNWQGWPPFDTLTMGEPVPQPFVALSDSTSDTTVYVGRGDGDGNFAIPDVPPGTYNMSIWDEQLNYIMRFLPVSVDAGQAVDLGDVGVSRWFAWLSGDVYQDIGVAANGTVLPAGTKGNGVRDCVNPEVVATCEAAIPNTDLDQRWRDGSIKEETFTNAQGHYEYPTAEGGQLGKWFIGEVGFTRFGTTGAAVHSEYDGRVATHVPTDLGGGLLTNQLLTEGHRATVDWGKSPYTDNQPGQIVGITYFATTRNEFDARMQAHENYEPGIPDVTVRLEGLGADGQPGTGDDVVLNEYVTDHWQAATGCDVRDSAGNDISAQLNPDIGPKCLEVPITGNETKDGAFDGGYAFADYCPAATGGFDHFNSAGDTVCKNGTGPVPLVAGTYITHVLMPKNPADTRDCNPVNSSGFKQVSGAAGAGCLYRPVREEDVNVDLGAQFIPAIPPPPCIGDQHVIDQSTLTSRSPYFGQSPSPSRPLCDKRLVVLENKQNANADFFMMPNFSNGADVAEPGRIVGLVSDDIYFDRDPQSIWYGEPRPIGNIPIGVRDYAGRLITTVTTSATGAYEVLLPSTETYNCPIPQGPCPGMYVVVVNDPGDKAHPNPTYNPNYLTASASWDVWPGLTTQLDTPLDPISGTGCELPVDTPELLQVSKPYVTAGDSATARQITIDGDFFGTTPGSVTLADVSPSSNRTLTTANGGIVSWNNRQIVIQVPVVGSAADQIRPGPKQLAVATSAGVSTTNGLTFHVRGNTAGVNYQPPVVAVGPPSDPHAIQNAVNAAAPGSLLVLRTGVYHENVVVWKPLIVQGLGPGGIVGASEQLQRDPEDPRFNIQGSTIDGRFFPDSRPAWDAQVASLGALAGVDADHPVLAGATFTVVAKSSTDYPSGLGAARIDGIGITTGRGEGAGGIQLQAYATNVQLTNNILESNGGIFAGGIGLGQPYLNSHNTGVRIANNRLMGNGGLNRSGGIGIFRGSDNYDLGANVICSNFGVEYGAGISHWGLSPGGSIHDNKIYFNDSVDSGAGINISQEAPQPLPDGTPVLGDGTGPVDIDRNLIEGNNSGDDGGGIFILDAHQARINVRSNMIVNNHAADLGGGVLLDDSSNVSFVNNTVANNATSASCESCDTSPHAAGLVSEKNDPLFQATLPAGAEQFANPIGFFNNIFWQNQAYTLSQLGPGATLVSQGFIDLEIHGTTNPADTFTPRSSILTSATMLGAGGQQRPLPGNVGNIIGQNPLFVTPFVLELAVTGSRGDPQTANVTITGIDPPVGLPGNYHLQPRVNGSPALDAGIASQGSISAPAFDIDNQPRPNGRFDIGADEDLGDAVGPALALPTATPSMATAGTQITLRAGASDTTTGNANIAAGEWFTGTDPGVGRGSAMRADDGVFNSPSEVITGTVNTTGWAVGTYTISLRAKDSNGNWGPVRTVSVNIR